jgi:hypothetical protein
MASSEMMTAVIASCAQAESESISKNMRWSYQKRMESGAFITCKAPFGYRLVDRRLIVEETEACIILMIFQDFLAGWSTVEISDKLTSMGIRTREGLDEWKPYTIKRILVNEKYIGDALLQKTVTTDFLNKKRVANKGIVPQYYVEGSHEAIIPRERFMQVQEEMVRRARLETGTGKRRVYSGKYALSHLVYCANCGDIFRRTIHRRGFKHGWREWGGIAFHSRFFFEAGQAAEASYCSLWHWG